MCLAVPAKIIAIDGTDATVDMGGVSRETSLLLVPDARLGDYVLIHAGFAIQTLDESEAQETLTLLAEMLAAEDAPPPSAPA